MTLHQPDLATRQELPDALRVLVREIPRAGWAEHQNYSQLIDFWLNRHMMFRQLLEQLTQDSQAALDRSMDPRTYKARLHRFGGLLINELHGHHMIEDMHYFPSMAKLDSRVSAGFDILDSDHHAMDAQLQRLAQGANDALQAGDDAAVREGAGQFSKTLSDFAPLLNRHLLDEEELVVPVLLKYAPAEFR
ncbi:hemerythrin domain-containing protein [Aestuariivita boseongensis]|uniref:hemerythrin domain-containing protein n=1 Tax=Aestuariivita boseongensis TaxID=1470562 RepID=UPI000680A474|nr:hemerythrin domain-containing protein [Aestuariivita boseongensis]